MPLLTLLADATTTIDPTQIISVVGSIGFAVWYGAYTAMYSLPNLEKAHAAQLDRVYSQMDKQDSQHAAEVKDLLAEMKEHREAFDRWKMGQRN